MNKENYDVLPIVNYCKRPKVILVGNGINLPFAGAHTTDAIIQRGWKQNYGEELMGRQASPTHKIWNIPFPLQIVAATKDHVQQCMTSLAELFKNVEVTEEKKSFIKQILDVNADTILTTNYSLEFEKSTIDNFTEHKVYSKYKKTKNQTGQQQRLGIFQCTELPCANNPLLWHIHGTALRKNSMVMGSLYYGKLLSEVTEQASSVIKKYKAAEKSKHNMHFESWIDYFLIGDVHIFGFGLDFSESDIWWLLSFKKSTFPDAKTYFYGLDITEEQMLMLKCYNVIVPEISVCGEQNNKNYLKFYEKVCKQLKGD